jgi:UDP-N-acetylglucosamine 2-epimerase (non-hydrolysing)
VVTQLEPTIHVFIGTKAQYIKTAPLLRLLEERREAHRLIDSGQHARLAAGLRRELAVREPDYVLGGSEDVTSIPAALRWAAAIAVRLWSRARVRRDVFAGRGGICVVHGDTPSTLLSALLAKRAGLAVAHLEAGLRSRRLWHPFPEELIRVVVMRLADILFAPDGTAVENLLAMRVRGRVVDVGANTVVEALAHSLAGAAPAADGPAVVTLHRVENLTSRRRVSGFVELVLRLAARGPVRFVVHGPTATTLRRAGHDRRLRAAGVELVELLPHRDFTRALAAAPLVVTDGGSIQEECALLGVPTLLWRDRTERPDGLGRNVVLSHYDPGLVEAFVRAPERWRHQPLPGVPTPSEEILRELRGAIRGVTDG